MVRQFEQPRHEDVALFVDLWQPDFPDQRQRENVELALSYAATLLTDACRGANARLLLAVAARDSAVKPGVASRAYLDDALETLAAAQPSDAPSLAGLVEQARLAIKAGCQVVVISTRAIEAPAALRSVAAGRLSLINVDAEEFAGRFSVPPVHESNKRSPLTAGKADGDDR